VKIEAELIAANTNTVLRALDFNTKFKLVAYAAANAILIMDPYFKPKSHGSRQVPKVLFTLSGHKERVNGVQWLSDTLLVSISADMSFIIWGFEGENSSDPESWKVKKVFENAHSATINYLRTYSTSDELYLLTMCADGRMKLWYG